jgi:O-antigen ligase
MVYRRKNDIPSTPLDYYLLAFIIAEGLATLFAYNQEQSLLYMYRRVTLLPVIFVVLANIRSTRMLKIFFGTLITSMIFVSLWSLRDLFFHLDEYVLFQRRLREFQMYMTAGGMMMFGMLLLLPFAVHPKTPSKLRWLATAALIPVGTNLLFTFTRSSWLGFLAGAVIIGAFRAKRILLPLLLIVLAMITFASPEMRERMSSIFNPYHPTNISRLHMWEGGIRIFKDNPIVGVGDIGIEQVWQFYAPPEKETVGHLHNNLLMWLVTLGIVGFAAIAAVFVKAWITVSRIERRLHDDWFLGSVALACLAIMAGFHVNGLFEWNFGDAEIIMVVWAVVGMTLAAEKVGQSEGRVA